MAGKTDFKAIMLARGEKFCLIAAVAVAGLLIVWGLLSAFGKIDPTKGTAELKQGAQGLRSKLNSDDGATAATSKKILPEYTPVDGSQFDVAVRVPFENATWPDKLRQMPDALRPIDSQIDFYLVSVRKHARDNFKYNEDGDLVDYTGQFITKQLDPKFNPKDAQKGFKESLEALKGGKPKKPSNRGPGNPGPGGPGPGGPGLPGPGLPGPGGPGGPGVPPGTMGGPGGSGEEGGGLGGFYQPGQLANKKTSEDVVTWLKYSEVIEGKTAAVPAYGVFPTRLAVVQLSFPLEDQLKEIQRALRLPTLRQAIQESSPEKLFATDPVSGKIVPYTSLYTGTGTPAGGPGVGPGVGPGGPGAPLAPPGVGLPPGGPGAPMGSEGPGTGSGAPLTASSIAAPVFAGFTVQRRKVIGGEVGDWEDFDHADRYFNEFTLYDTPTKTDVGYLPYFLRSDQGMAAPIPVIAPYWTGTPQLAANEEAPTTRSYPELVRMPSIRADFEALQKILKPVSKKQAIGGQKRNPNNPYSFGGGQAGGVGGSGIPGIPGMGGPGEGETEGPGVMGPPRGPGNPGQGNPGGVAEFNKNPMAVKHMLIRFLDTDLLPGVSYQYQVKVKVRNPNFNKKKDVADEKLADVEFIESKYYECRQTLKVPGESHLFAGTIKDYEKRVSDLQDKLKEDNNGRVGLINPSRLNKLFETQEVKEGKRAVVQMQRWVHTTSFGGEEERIGAWVQADVPVAVGEFIGRRTLVELPLWKAAKGQYQLTPTPKTLVTGWVVKDAPNQPAGRPVDFRTRHVLLDFEGGRAKTPVDGRSVEDESATELLILRDDGKLEVRKELADAELPERKTRDKNWQDWIADVRKGSPATGTGTGPGGFEGPRGPGGGSPPTPGGGGR